MSVSVVAVALLLIATGTPAVGLSSGQVPTADRGVAGAQPQLESSHDAGARSAEGDLLARVARGEGSVRVIVRMNVDFVPEARLPAQAAASRRAEFARQRDALHRALQQAGAETLRELRTVPFLALEVSEAALELLHAAPQVASIHRDEAVPLLLSASGPMIQSGAMHAAGFTGQGQMVAVLDTSVDTSHPFFDARTQEPSLGVNKIGLGQGTVGSDPVGIDCGATCSVNLPVGTTVTLTATADEGSTFAGWS